MATNQAMFLNTFVANVSIDDIEALSTTHVPSIDRTVAEVGESLEVSMTLKDASWSRSSRFDETLKASIAQALEMGQELMWHDNETIQETAEQNHQTIYRYELQQSCDQIIDEFQLSPNELRSSSNIAQPQLRRKVTSKNTVSRYQDPWSEFINRKTSCNRSCSSSLRRGIRQSKKTVYIDDLPRQVNISIGSTECDDVSCLMDDAVEDSSYFPVDSSILNEFLYGDCFSYDDKDKNKNKIDNNQSSEHGSATKLASKHPMLIITDAI